MKKISKLLSILLVLGLMVGSVAFAASGDVTHLFDDVQPGDLGGIGGAAANFMGYIRAACYIVGVFMLTWAGFKYLTAGAGKKAEAKETIIPIIIGSAIIILAPTLFGFIWGAFSG